MLPIIQFANGKRFESREREMRKQHKKRHLKKKKKTGDKIKHKLLFTFHNEDNRNRAREGEETTLRKQKIKWKVRKEERMRESDTYYFLYFANKYYLDLFSAISFLFVPCPCTSVSRSLLVFLVNRFVVESAYWNKIKLSNYRTQKTGVSDRRKALNKIIITALCLHVYTNTRRHTHRGGKQIKKTVKWKRQSRKKRMNRNILFFRFIILDQ